MIHLIISDIYKYICSFLNDVDYRSLTKTCKVLFQKRGDHLLTNYYSLNVLLKTGYNILCLDLIKLYDMKQQHNISGLFMKRLYMVKFISVDSKFLKNLKEYYRDDVYITYYMNENDKENTIPDNISKVIVKQINDSKKVRLHNGLKLKSLTIHSNTDISSLNAPNLEILHINDSYVHNKRTLDLSKFKKLHSVNISNTDISVIFPDSLTSLNITFAFGGIFVIKHLTSLKRLVINEEPDHKLELPPNIEYLKLNNFDKEIELPNSLKRIRTGEKFDQEIKLNEGLVFAQFGKHFGRKLKLPLSLKTLIVGKNFGSHITFNNDLEFFDISRVQNISRICIDDVPNKTHIKMNDLVDIFKIGNCPDLEEEQTHCFDDSEEDGIRIVPKTITCDNGYSKLSGARFEFVDSEEELEEGSFE